MIQTLHAILSAHRVEIAIENGHADASPARRRGRHVAGPLIRLRVVPLDTVQVALAVVSADSVEEIIEHSYANTAASFTHWRDHLPVDGVRVESLDTCYRIARAPAAHRE